MVTVRTTKALDFACHSKACAPPPVGKGGSGDGGFKSGGGKSNFAPTGTGGSKDINKVRLYKEHPGEPTTRRDGTRVHWSYPGAKTKGDWAKANHEYVPGKGWEPKRTANAGVSVKATSLKRGDKVIFAQQAKTVRWVGKESKGRIPVSFETGGITDIARDQTLPRA